MLQYVIPLVCDSYNVLHRKLLLVLGVQGASLVVVVVAELSDDLGLDSIFIDDDAQIRQLAFGALHLKCECHEALLRFYSPVEELSIQYPNLSYGVR